jgi:acyl dehydratase
VNLPEHADNAIHTDAGGRAAGFAGALVAGVTTYAYLTRPLVEAWGLDWLRSGSAEVRFFQPVLEGDELTCRTAMRDGAWLVEAVVARSESPLAELVTREAAASPDPSIEVVGEILPTETVTLAGRWSDYGTRCGDDLALYVREGIVHPSVWPALANHVVHTRLVQGPWIHVRSVIDHRDVARVGETVEVRSAVIARRSGRRGQRATLDVRIDGAGGPIARLEHEAIVALA